MTVETHERRGRPPRGYIETEFLNRINQFQQEHPVGAINFRRFVEPGKGTRQRLEQIYKAHKETDPLPPVAAGQNQILPEDYIERLDRAVESKLASHEAIGEIARSLSVPQSWALESRRRIDSRKVKEEDPLLSLVEANRLKGIGGTALARQLEIPRSKIQWKEKKLIKEGRVDKMRNRRTRSEVAKFDLQVKGLRDEEDLRLEDEEIGWLLFATMGQTQSSIRRLIRKREIKSRGNNHFNPGADQPQK
ncbi:hypothetical protein A3C59_02080 [Candidatus Daviesbacteria bacterium RIFCSPHIGHO2_02_FULL_36_13]|uniref:Uncharacterized protein n=1 Tax=Candidatus Daviesbacteria bacterium RIFCSPHIGHO2_02_FULL_36_13 TaxID=1797768 RepID=A0A1F5JVH3_9BACT|nr:MAG: hypothetical protein A3C59_02080 [Candidatus Daviesbacteria bacterium RIFCSPHIGHO2_02_FULL_36_13]OGE41079.1 MAG: hypothetical protein A3A45_00175 [Candidatus Daviesbacteria bacterium RIFCSPLOWO2_01_FULL_36_8]